MEAGRREREEKAEKNIIFFLHITKTCLPLHSQPKGRVKKTGTADVGKVYKTEDFRWFNSCREDIKQKAAGRLIAE